MYDAMHLFAAFVCLSGLIPLTSFSLPSRARRVTEAPDSRPGPTHGPERPPAGLAYPALRPKQA